MRVLSLPSVPLTSYGSSGASLRPAARVLEPVDGLAVDVVRLGPGGAIGRHPTPVVVQCRVCPLTEEAP